MRVISFAIGNIWRWEKNRAHLIKYIRKLDIDGVEVTLGFNHELVSFVSSLSKSDRNWLRSLRYVSIHAPFNLADEMQDEKDVVRRLGLIEKLYKDVNAKNVIIHSDVLPRPGLLNRYKFNVSTENLEPYKKVSIKDLKEIFKKYPKAGLCLDVGHAYFYGKHETKKLVEVFGDRITQIHFSGNYRSKDHVSLRKVSKDFLSSIRPIKGLEAPIVIEEDIDKGSLKYLKDEIKYIKSLFK